MVRSPEWVDWWVWCLVRRRPRVRTATDGCRVLNPVIRRPAQAVAVASFVKGLRSSSHQSDGVSAKWD